MGGENERILAKDSIGGTNGLYFRSGFEAPTGPDEQELRWL